MTIYDDYFNYCDKWKRIYGEKTYVLMEVGSFFEIYGLMDSDGVVSGNDMDALEKMTNLTANVKENSLHDGKKVIMAGFMPAQFSKFTRFVSEYDYTLIIYKQVKQGDRFTRVFSDIISPGSVFDDEGTSISNVTLCLWIEYVRPMKFIEECVVLGVSTLDIFTGTTTMHEIAQPFKHEPNTYDEIEKLVSIYRPREAIIISNLENPITNEIVSFVGLDNCKNYIINYTDSDFLLSKYIKNADKQTFQKASLNKYYPELSDEYIITDVIQKYSISLQSFVVLLDYMYEHNCDFTSKLKFPEFKHETNKLILANHSLKQLNILDDNRHKGKYKSVSSFLNNCRTNMGIRKFQYDLHNPINRIDVLNEGYHMTDSVIATEEWKQYRESLTTIMDLDKFKRALLMKKTSPKMFAKLHSNLKIIVELATNTQANNTEVYEYSTRNGNPITNGTRLITKLEETFNIDIAACVSEVSTENLSNSSIARLHFINPGVSDDIDSALNKYHDCLAIRHISEEINLLFFCFAVRKQVLRQNGLGKLHFFPNTGFFIHIKRRIHCVRGDERQRVCFGQVCLSIHNGSAKPFHKCFHIFGFTLCVKNNFGANLFVGNNTQRSVNNKQWNRRFYPRNLEINTLAESIVFRSNIERYLFRRNTFEIWNGLYLGQPLPLAVIL